jgi:16S rRNA (guanine966-N2)-methyltransferase
MSEKARGAIFNALGDVEGLTFLDAYAGSGALSIEAMSRGAASGVAVDSDLAASRTIVANLKSFGVDRMVRAVQMNVTSWSDANLERVFDLVFADPPYDDIRLPAVAIVANHTKLQGIFTLSWPGGQDLPIFDGFDLVSEKPLGDIKLGFYRRK